MMKFIYPITLLAALSMAACSQAQNAMDEVKIETVKLNDTLYMLTGRGGNIGVSAGDDGVFLIDDQFAPLTDKIKAAINEISDSPIRYVVNTHWHGDHTGGNENLGNSGVTIVAHDNVRARMATKQVMKAFGREVPASPEAALPTITYHSRMTFYINGEEVRVLHQPRAHTDGDSMLHFVKSNVVHGGDLVFNGAYPFIDTSSGGSLDGLIMAIEKLLAVADEETKIIPGHGPLASRDDIVVYHAMLTDVRSRLQALLDEGLPLAAAEMRDPLKDYNEKWGQGFMKPDTFLRIVYTSMAEQ